MVLEELKKEIPDKLHTLMEIRDGAPKLVEALNKEYATADTSIPGAKQRAWECAGLYYLHQRRFHEAMNIFSVLYDRILLHQNETGKWVHKGMPLVWLRDIHLNLNHPVIGKRYAMLTLCEDSIKEEGNLNAEKSGIYFRLVWHHGMSNREIKRYANKIFTLYKSYPKETLYPEWILQEIDHQWMTEFPSPNESSEYHANTKYVEDLLVRIGEGSGKILERLADYVLSCIPGFRTYRRQLTESTEYDVVCAVDGFNLDFRSDFGRYIICECKDWVKPVDFSSMAKFCRILDSAKCKFGIIFSKEGLSGKDKGKYAEREQLKVFQDRGMVIVVVDLEELKKIAKGANFTALLRSKYEKVRLDLRL